MLAKLNCVVEPITSQEICRPCLQKVVRAYELTITFDESTKYFKNLSPYFNENFNNGQNYFFDCLRKNSAHCKSIMAALNKVCGTVQGKKKILNENRKMIETLFNNNVTNSEATPIMLGVKNVQNNNDNVLNSFVETFFENALRTNTENTEPVKQPGSTNVPNFIIKSVPSQTENLPQYTVYLENDSCINLHECSKNKDSLNSSTEKLDNTLNKDNGEQTFFDILNLDIEVINEDRNVNKNNNNQMENRPGLSLEPITLETETLPGCAVDQNKTDSVCKKTNTETNINEHGQNSLDRLISEHMKKQEEIMNANDNFNNDLSNNFDPESFYAEFFPECFGPLDKNENINENSKVVTPLNKLEINNTKNSLKNDDVRKEKNIVHENSEIHTSLNKIEESNSKNTLSNENLTKVEKSSYKLLRKRKIPSRIPLETEILIRTNRKRKIPTNTPKIIKKKKETDRILINGKNIIKIKPRLKRPIENLELKNTQQLEKISEKPKTIIKNKSRQYAKKNNKGKFNKKSKFNKKKRNLDNISEKKSAVPKEDITDNKYKLDTSKNIADNISEKKSVLDVVDITEKIMSNSDKIPLATVGDIDDICKIDTKTRNTEKTPEIKSILAKVEQDSKSNKKKRNLDAISDKQPALTVYDITKSKCELDMKTRNTAVPEENLELDEDQHDISENFKSDKKKTSVDNISDKNPTAAVGAIDDICKIDTKEINTDKTSKKKSALDVDEHDSKSNKERRNLDAISDKQPAFTSYDITDNNCKLDMKTKNTDIPEENLELDTDQHNISENSESDKKKRSLDNISDKNPPATIGDIDDICKIDTKTSNTDKTPEKKSVLDKDEHDSKSNKKKRNLDDISDKQQALTAYDITKSKCELDMKTRNKDVPEENLELDVDTHDISENVKSGKKKRSLDKISDKNPPATIGGIDDIYKIDTEIKNTDKTPEKKSVLDKAKHDSKSNKKKRNLDAISEKQPEITAYDITKSKCKLEMKTKNTDVPEENLELDVDQHDISENLKSGKKKRSLDKNPHTTVGDIDDICKIDTEARNTEKNPDEKSVLGKVEQDSKSNKKKRNLDAISDKQPALTAYDITKNKCKLDMKIRNTDIPEENLELDVDQHDISKNFKSGKKKRSLDKISDKNPHTTVDDIDNICKIPKKKSVLHIDEHDSKLNKKKITLDAFSDKQPALTTYDVTKNKYKLDMKTRNTDISEESLELDIDKHDISKNSTSDKKKKSLGAISDKNSAVIICDITKNKRKLDIKTRNTLLGIDEYDSKSNKKKRNIDTIIDKTASTTCELNENQRKFHIKTRSSYNNPVKKSLLDIDEHKITAKPKSNKKKKELGTISGKKPALIECDIFKNESTFNIKTRSARNNPKKKPVLYIDEHDVTETYKPKKNKKSLDTIPDKIPTSSAYDITENEIKFQETRNLKSIPEKKTVDDSKSNKQKRNLYNVSYNQPGLTICDDTKNKSKYYIRTKSADNIPEKKLGLDIVEHDTEKSQLSRKRKNLGTMLDKTLAFTVTSNFDETRNTDNIHEKKSLSDIDEHYFDSHKKKKNLDIILNEKPASNEEDIRYCTNKKNQKNIENVKEKKIFAGIHPSNIIFTKDSNLLEVNIKEKDTLVVSSDAVQDVLMSALNENMIKQTDFGNPLPHSIKTTFISCKWCRKLCLTENIMSVHHCCCKRKY